jgi:hypothetical protein
MSDTPETDAAADWYLAAAYSTDPEDRTVPLAVSRKLERERNEWAAMCGGYKQERDIAEADATNFHARIFQLINERDEAREAIRALAEHGESEIQRITKERDEAREALADVEEYGTEEINTAVRLRRKLATALVERDEAREDLENHAASTIHSCHDQCQRPMCVLRRERDEARRDLEFSRELYKVQEELLDVTRCQRDEARAQNAKEGAK